MNISGSVASFVGMFVLMVGATLLLRRRGILKAEHSSLLSVIMLDFVCPPLIFASTARAHLQLQEMYAAGSVFGAEVVICALSYLIGRWALRLDRMALGAFIIAATFGSTGLIGNALVQILFHGDPEIVSMSMIIGSFGVGIPGNTIGMFLAMRFSTKGRDLPVMGQVKSFLLMPCMIALYAGYGWSLLALPTAGPVIDVVFGASMMIGASLPFIVALIVGLSLKPIQMRTELGVLVVGALLALVIEPIISARFVDMFSVDSYTRMITVLYAAMPSTPLGVVLAIRYGGDAELAGKLATFTLVVSALTLPLVALL